MRYKILLIGTHQALINDFFYHMDNNFECLSSSTRTEDILGHLTYYEPDGLIYCLNKENKDIFSNFRSVFQQLSAKKVPLIIVGTQEVCLEFGKMFPSADYLTIVRPISTKSLEEKITAYLRSRCTKTKAETSGIKDFGIGDKKIEAVNNNIDELEETLASIDKMVRELEEMEQKAQPSEPEARERKKHILIVDDDSRVLRLVKNVLSDHYNVATAISGKVAMKFLENKETDLVLLDYEMPEENGAQVLQKIRNNAKLRKLPVVFLTGVTEGERIKEVLALSPQGYLLKPIDTELLKNTLQDIFGKMAK